MSAPSTYRDRLRVEGTALGASGALGSALLLGLTDEATRWPWSTGVQVGAVGVLLATFGTRSVRRALDRSTAAHEDDVGDGQPTPLWQLPAICAGLTLAVSLPDVGRAGWDAGLRVTLGCALVGVFQAVVFERQVAARERATGRRFFRGPGSRLGRGTVLLHRG